MRAKGPWSRALLVSCVIHCLLLAVIGWAGILSFKAAEAEQFIELALVNDIAAREPANVSASAASPSVAAASKTESVVQTNSAMSAPEVTTATASTESSALVAYTNGSAAANTAISSSNRAETIGGRLIPPRILQKVEPIYPDEMRRQGTAGTVIVRIDVLENGRSANVSVQRSSGVAALDEAAIQATRQWRFVPARDEATGLAVRCYTTLSVVFRLN